MLKFLKALAALALCMGCYKASFASQFFVFPVKEIEGAAEKGEAKIRPLIDRSATAFLTPDAQQEVLKHFVQQLAATYPESIVGPRQVRDVLQGKYAYLDSDSLPCGNGFVAPLRRSYAVVIGLTRASYYEVPRVGDRVEVLLPITLNIQLVKPDSAKVVASASDTLYSTFIFSKSELNSPSAKAKVTEIVLKGVKEQINSLLAEIKKNFSPKETAVRLVDSTDGVFVADKGFEIGFKDGDEPAAISKKDGKEAIFRVVTADSGYSVLKPLAGSPQRGEEYVFLFESPADDSRKPKLLPVTSFNADRLWTHGISDILVKDIGFKAPFQLAPVDANFRDTMESISRQANCVPWDKFPSSKTVSDSRLDHPQFLMKLDYSRSPVATAVGVGGVRSTESFMTGVTAQVLDLDGNVLFSDAAVDSYKLERTAGQGISQISAFEISMKNATVALSKKIISSLQLNPSEFRISRVEKNKFVVDGLKLPEGESSISYEVIRPLDVKVAGKNTFMRLQLGDGQEEPLAEGSGTAISYSKLEDEPKRGDIVRVRGFAKKGQQTVAECKDAYKAPGTLDADYVLPFVRQAAYVSPRHRMTITDPQFYEDVNTLLHAGFFKHRVKAKSLPETCVKSGYLVKLESSKCGVDGCAVQMLSAITLIQEKGGTRVGNYVHAEKITIEGFTEKEIANFVGLKAFETATKNITKLSEKFSTAK
jgi:hypothetical protein